MYRMTYLYARVQSVSDPFHGRTEFLLEFLALRVGQFFFTLTGFSAIHEAATRLNGGFGIFTHEKTGRSAGKLAFFDFLHSIERGMVNRRFYLIR